MESQVEQIRLRLHFCMAAIGGCFGAFTVLNLGHFGSAATNNLIELFTKGAQGSWAQSLQRLGAVAVYILSLFLTAWLPKRIRGDLRLAAILLDGAAAIALCLLPGESMIPFYISLFTMAFQWSTFASKIGYPCSTIFSTNNLRQFVDACVQVHLNRDSTHAPRMRLYGGTLLAFHTGVIAVCLLWRLLHHWTILLVPVVLMPLALSLRHQDVLWYHKTGQTPPKAL